MHNILLQHIMRYFYEINHLESRLIVVGSSFSMYKENLATREPKSELIGAVTGYRPAILGSTGELTIPDSSYSLTAEGLESELKTILSYECGLCLAQCYEVFESYIFTLLTEFALLSITEFPFLRDELGAPFVFKEARHKIKSKRGKNLKGILFIVKAVSKHFSDITEQNDFDISNWFDVFSTVRHVLVHNRQKISLEMRKYFDEQSDNQLWAVFHKNFSTAVKEGVDTINFDINSTSDQIIKLNSIAHLLFESLSLQLNLPTTVPKYIPRQRYPLEMYISVWR